MARKSNKATRAMVYVVGLTFAVALVLAVLWMPDMGFGKTIAKEDSSPISVSDNTGLGTSESPWLIGSAQTLRSRLLASEGQQMNRHFALIADIDLGDTSLASPFRPWTPIPLFDRGSVFEGNGHTINGLWVNSGTNRGLFGVFRGTMRNVNFTDASIQGQGATLTQIGIVAGEVSGAAAIMGTNAVLIDNVRVLSGNIGHEVISTNTAARTGGIFGRITAAGTSNLARYSVTIQNSMVTIPIRGANSMGGFIGMIGEGSTNLNLVVRNCFHRGTLHNTSNIAGGILGAFWHNTNVTALVENSYSLGPVIRTEDRWAGGLVGLLYASAQLTIRNSFVIAQVTGVSTEANPLLGGIIGGGQSAEAGRNARIENSFFSSTASPNLNVSGQNIPAANFATSGSRTTAQMMTPEFLALINAGSDNFVAGLDGLPQLRVFTERIFLTFDSNGGKFPSGDPDLFLGSWVKDYILNPGDVPVPTRFGYTFSGWSTLPDGGVLYTIPAQIPVEVNRTLYARWVAVMYNVRAEVDVDAEQTILFYTDTEAWGLHESRYTIHQRGYLKTYLAQDDGNMYFLGWQARESATATWINIGSGRAVTEDTPQPAENRLELFTNEAGYLIDEAFITRFAQQSEGEYTILFRALFENQTPRTVTFDVAHVSMIGWGSLRVDGTNRLFGSSVQYSHAHSDAMTIAITPNRYYTFENLIRVTPSERVVIPTAKMGDGTHQPVVPIIPEDGMHFEIEFGLETYQMRVIASIPEVTNMVGAISSTLPISISLGNTISGIQISAVSGFNLVNPSFNNIRIFNNIMGEFEHFSAIGGGIYFPAIDASFLDRFMDGTGMITVIAMYVRQFSISVNVVNAHLGSIGYTVTHTNGVTHNPFALGDFDEGTIITINIVPTGAAMIAKITGVEGSEVNHAGNVITVRLVGNRAIGIEFTVMEYTFGTWAVDTFGNDFDPSIIQVSTPTGTFNEGNTVPEISVKYDDEAYEFLGWYALVNGELVSLHGRVEVNPETNSIVNLLLDPGFIENYSYNNEFSIVARFGTVHAVIFDIANFDMEGKGSFRAIVVVWKDGVWVEEGAPIDTSKPQEFVQNTFIKIEVTPAQFYSLHSIDGLHADEILQGNTVIIIVDGLRSISINFDKRRFEISPTFNLDKAMGSADVSVTSIAVGEVVIITFMPQSGFQLSDFKINGISVGNITNATISGNVVMLTITTEWLEQHGPRVDVSISTTMNRVLMIGLIVAAIFVPLGLLGAIMITMLNNRKKKAYNDLMEKRRQREGMHGQVDLLRQVRGGAPSKG